MNPKANTIPASELPYAPDPSWRAWPPQTPGGKWTIDADGGPMMPLRKIAVFHGDHAGENAELAAKAVNCRDTLIEALEGALAAMTFVSVRTRNEAETLQEACISARLAISKAKGQF